MNWMTDGTPYSSPYDVPEFEDEEYYDELAADDERAEE